MFDEVLLRMFELKYGGFGLFWDKICVTTLSLLVLLRKIGKEAVKEILRVE